MVASWEYNEMKDRSCYNVRSDTHRFKSICTTEGCGYVKGEQLRSSCSTAYDSK